MKFNSVILILSTGFASLSLSGCPSNSGGNAPASSCGGIYRCDLRAISASVNNGPSSQGYCMESEGHGLAQGQDMCELARGSMTAVCVLASLSVENQACPTATRVGRCNSGLGQIPLNVSFESTTAYYSPHWTTNTAQADCQNQQGSAFLAN